MEWNLCAYEGYNKDTLAVEWKNVKEQLELNEVLRAVNHDTLNRLQVMQMNLDLGRTEEVRRLIEEYSLRCQYFFRLNNAGFMQTNNWLETIHMYHPELKATYEVTGTEKATPAQDIELVEMFQVFVLQMKQRFTGYHDQLMHVLFCMDAPLEIHIQFVGSWTDLQGISCERDAEFTTEVLEYTKTSLKLKLVARRGQE